jgi:hypothetical protein
VLDALAAVNLLENERLLVQTVGRDDDRYRLANSLLGSETEKPLGAVVPAEDDPAKVLRYDGVVKTTRLGLGSGGRRGSGGHALVVADVAHAPTPASWAIDPHASTPRPQKQTLSRPRYQTTSWSIKLSDA